ncbi:potassium transporter TrkG [uncultured Megasphaera sp.]|uniref:TrkH family potassium uptake protein n=1 Tax=uncultured Megasphaera sp. TaxID=165188 RepID=UPI0028690E9D|nr:potassium transporter TrkG [uncultured Megasphaera sp.]
MNRNVVFYLIGCLAVGNGLVLLIPMAAALFWGEAGLRYFGPAAAAALLFGGYCLYRGRTHKRHLGAGEGAWYMVAVWVFLGLLGMIPYLMAGTFASPADAFFESVSAFTTTGTSCLADGGAALPASLFLWHSLMEWLGGLNFILILVSVLPQVSGCFGLTLSVHQSVAFSPMVSRMESAARQAGCIYVAITLCSMVLYWLAGLPAGTAFHQGLMTMSTSGGDALFDFSNYDSLGLEAAGALSMLLASGNFLLYWKAWERRDVKSLFKDAELRTVLILIAFTGLIVSLHLWRHGVYDGWDNLRYGFFQVLSFSSTSGFASADYAAWPEFDKYILFALAFVGGCIGSATGGLKVMRFMVLFKMAAQEMRRTLHPHMVISLKIDDIPVDMKIISRVLSYFFLFMGTFFLSMLIISLSGVTPMQAMGVAIGCLSSVGSTMELFGINDVSVLPAWTKIYCSFLMILGRVEIFSFLIVLQTAFGYLRRRW